MAIYAVDSKRQKMIATGNVSPVNEWIDTPDGRRQSDEQARDADTGMLLFDVEVVYPSVSFGKPVTVTASVTVGAMEAPKPGLFSPIEFINLECSVNLMKNGGMRESWRAERLADGKPAANAAAPKAQAA